MFMSGFLGLAEGLTFTVLGPFVNIFFEKHPGYFVSPLRISGSAV